MEAEIKRLAPRALRIRPPKPVRVDTQTLVYPFDESFARFLVSYPRTPSRVLWDVFEIEAERLEPLFEEIREFVRSERPRWLADGVKISIPAPEQCDFPASGLQIRGTIKNAIVEGARAHGMEVEVDAESPDLELIVRGRKRPLVLSIDLAGGSMHARGYRLEEGEAPLKENVAAQMLMLARWDVRTEMLIDPLAGAGTIPIEAALMARGAPLWAAPKKPAIDRIPPFAGRGSAQGDLFADAQPVIVANEIHTPLIEAMRRNAARAGAADQVLSLHGDLRDLTRERIVREVERKGWEPLERGLLIANPPYGERLKKTRGGEPDLAALYAALFDLYRTLGKGWRAAFIVANDEFERSFQMKPAMKKPIWNGSIRAFALVYGPS
jgi:23S rRNA G2445 N2-methylase RlmL